jgi:predicted ATPase
MTKVCRIAVTGGPGGGKTTVWRALRDAHPELCVAVPEVATMMFTHVFPQVESAAERRHLQRAIFHVQKNLEAFHESRLREGQILLCDRGTPDGAGYWPEGPAAFFEAMGASWDRELERYDAVLFLQTAAAGGLSIAEGNPTRMEDHAAAIATDQQLYETWSRHPRFCFVEQCPDFTIKVRSGRDSLVDWLAR